MRQRRGTRARSIQPDNFGMEGEPDSVPEDLQVYLVICGSAIAHDNRGEIVETTEWLPDGKPDWTAAAACDVRGGGGPIGYQLLAEALRAAELNAFLLGA